MRATTAARPASTRPDESVSSKPNGPCSLLRKLRSTAVLSSSSRSGSAGSTVPRFDASRLRSEEHTSELQSHSDLVCRLLLEKKKKNYHTPKASIRRETGVTQ